MLAAAKSDLEPDLRRRVLEKSARIERPCRPLDLQSRQQRVEKRETAGLERLALAPAVEEDRLLRRVASGADLTFAIRLAARLRSECQIQCSTSFIDLLVVL